MSTALRVRSRNPRRQQLALGILLPVLLLMVTGLFIAFSHNQRPSHHAFHLLLGLAAIIGTAMLPAPLVLRTASMVLSASLLAMVALPFLGTENFGATRWLTIGEWSLQPSEFLKPAMLIVCARWLATDKNHLRPLVFMLYALIALLLLIQPDFGQLMILSTVLIAQFYLAGLNNRKLIIIAAWILGLILLSYWLLPHVAQRIDQFLFEETDRYSQAGWFARILAEGGLFGKGIGSGTLKNYVLFSTSDFVFASITEDFGLIGGLFVVLLFAAVTLCGTLTAAALHHEVHRLVVAGLTLLITVQSIVNIGSVASLFPPKGTTLPFLSSGGSSMLAMSWGVGVVLALIRADHCRRRALQEFANSQRSNNQGPGSQGYRASITKRADAFGGAQTSRQ